jgi:RimJ/RimL family protein N-acetyltransferase
MREITLKLFEKNDIERLYEFNKENENANKSSSDENFYEFSFYEKIATDILEQEKNGRLFLYLGIDNNDKIIGNISLGIKESDGCRTAIIGGYLGKNHRMKGYSIDAALKLILQIAQKEHKANRIEANTSNIVIQKLLLRNGFQYSKRPALQSKYQIIDNSISFELYPK